jgi:WD40 repeat protein
VQNKIFTSCIKKNRLQNEFRPSMKHLEKMNFKSMLNIRKFKFESFTLLVLVFLKILPAHAQGDWAKTNIKETQRVDLRDLGYPFVNEIPANSSAITSLLTSNDNKIYGATSGKDSYLFMFDPAINKVRPLGKIGDQKGAHHSLVEGKDSSIYIGTGIDMFEEIPLSKAMGEQVDKALWNDIKNYFKNYSGGHIYRYKPAKSNNKVKLSDMQCELEDLGIPLANNSIYALTVSQKGDEIYGLTYPDGHFFIYNIQGKKISDLGPVDEKNVFHGPERCWRSLPRSLICDDSGKVFMSGTEGIIRYYDPLSKKLVSTNMKIPGDNYYMMIYKDYTVVEYFAKDASGLIYGGTSDGYLFSLDTHLSKLKNLGKVRSSRRLRCLTIGKDGKVYLIAGERSTSRACQFYSYDPNEGEFEDLGLLIADRSPYYYWRGQQFDAMVTGNDGTIFIGESERRSHLFLYIP